MLGIDAHVIFSINFIIIIDKNQFVYKKKLLSNLLTNLTYIDKYQAHAFLNHFRISQ